MNSRKWVLKVYIEDDPRHQERPLTKAEILEELTLHPVIPTACNLPRLLCDGLAITDYDLQKEEG